NSDSVMFRFLSNVESFQDRGTAQLIVPSPWIVFPVGDVLSPFLVVRGAPVVRAVLMVNHFISKTVVCLEQRQGAAIAPVGPAGRARWPLHERVNSRVMPGLEWPAAARDMRADLVPRVALGYGAFEIEVGLAIVDDADSPPWNAGFRFDRRVDLFAPLDF